MPRSSRSLATLERDIQRLRRQLLPPVFDPTNNYRNPKAVQAKTRAFLVLAHAEFECYFEEWASDLVKAALAAWKKSGRVITPLDYLVATFPKPLSVSPKVSVSAADDMPQKLAAHLEVIVSSYLATVNENHGIKEPNIAALLGRLGVPASVFGTTLLPALTTYGDRRGKHVHNSAANVAVLLVLDPQDEFSRAIKMIQELKPLHAWFVATRKKIR